MGRGGRVQGRWSGVEWGKWPSTWRRFFFALHWQPMGLGHLNRSSLQSTSSLALLLLTWPFASLFSLPFAFPFAIRTQVPPSQCFDILTLIRPKCCVFSNQTDNNAIAAAHTSANICPASKCVWFRVPRAVCIRCFEREMGGSGWCTWHISCIDHNHPTNKSQILLQKI